MPKILDVRNLRITFPIQGKPQPAVDGISFHLNQGKVLGIVGESGCGKTVTALSLLRLIESPGRIADGQAFYYGDIPGLSLPKVQPPPPKLREEDSEGEDESTPFDMIQLEAKRREPTAEVCAEKLPDVGGIDLFSLSEAQMREVRGHKIAMIFQE